MKKAISSVLALGMSLSMLTACGGAASSSTAASTAGSASTATSTSAAATGTGDYAGQTLKVAAIETAYGAEMWQQIVDGFEAKRVQPLS